MLQRLAIAFALVKASNTSKNSLDEISKIIYSFFYQETNATEKHTKI